MGRWQFKHAPKNGLRCRDVAIGEVIIQGAGVHVPTHTGVFEKRLQFRGKDELSRGLGVKERLLADTVASQQQPLPVHVPQGEGEHAAKEFDTAVAVLLIGMDNDFGITLCDKLMITLPKPGTQFLEIVDFAIKRDPDRPILVRHGLMPAGVVYDTESTLTQSYRTMSIITFRIRSTMLQPSA